jgi:hypothetical protein
VAVKVWYFIGMIEDRIIHVDHDVFSETNGEEIARTQAQKWFDDGVIIEGEIVKFTRVSAISESHQIALDISRSATFQTTF